MQQKQYISFTLFALLMYCTCDSIRILKPRCHIEGNGRCINIRNGLCVKCTALSSVVIAKVTYSQLGELSANSLLGVPVAETQNKASALSSKRPGVKNERCAISHIPSFLSDGVELAVDGPRRYTLYHVSPPYDRAALLISLLHWPI